MVSRRMEAKFIVESSGLSGKQAVELYKKNLLLVVRGASDLPQQDQPPPSKKKATGAAGKGGSGCWGGEDLRTLYKEGRATLGDTFCVEGGKEGRGESSVDAIELLGREGGDGWYASFILQKDKSLFAKTLQSLPVQQPSFLPGSRHRYTEAVCPHSPR